MSGFRFRPRGFKRRPTDRLVEETELSSASDTVLERKEALKMNPSPMITLGVEERIDICKQIPQQEWDRFSRFKYVAISATQKRILDADNDEVTLDRVAASHPEDCVFHVPARKSRSPRRAR
jgi:hypothetical protein